MSDLFNQEVYPKLYIKKVDGMLQRALKLPDGYYEAYTAARYREDKTPYGGPYRVLNNGQIEYLKQNYKDVIYKELPSINMGYWVFKNE